MRTFYTFENMNIGLKIMYNFVFVYLILCHNSQIYCRLHLLLLIQIQSLHTRALCGEIMQKTISFRITNLKFYTSTVL